MSLPREVCLNCRHCGKKFETMLWDTVNSLITPEMVPSVRNLNIFKKKCPHCHEITYAVHPLLYHQMEDKFMVQFMPDEGAFRFMLNMPKEANPWREMQSQGYVIRVTSDTNDFAEKIMLLDKKIDDRAVAIVKLGLIHHVAREQKDPNEFLSHDIETFVDIEDEEKDIREEDNFNIHLMIDGEYMCSSAFQWEMYDDMKARIDKLCGTIDKDPTLNIDMSWAGHTLNMMADMQNDDDTGENNSSDDNNKKS